MAQIFERQRHILDFTLASLLRRKGKNGALFAVYTLIVFLLASVLFFTHALKREASLVLSQAPEIVVQRTLTGRYQSIPAAYGPELAQIRGVVSVRPRLWGYYYDPNFLANYTLMVPTERPPAPGTIAVGSGIARMHGAFVGDTLGFTGFDGRPRGYAIARLLSEESQLVSADLILMNEVDYRRLSGLPKEQVTDFALSVLNPKEVVTVAEKIKRLRPDTRPIMRKEILRTYDAVFGWRAGVVLLVFSGAAVAFAIFAWDKATGLSAEERKEIGILKAVGWESSDILALKFWEGITVSLTSFLTGIALGYAHVFCTDCALFAPVLKGWSTLYPSFRLTPFLDFGQLSALFFLTVVPYTVSTIVPSWRAATVDPDQVMR